MKKVFGLYVDNELWCYGKDIDKIYNEYKKLKNKYQEFIKNRKIIIESYELSMTYEVNNK